MSDYAGNTREVARRDLPRHPKARHTWAQDGLDEWEYFDNMPMQADGDIGESTGKPRHSTKGSDFDLMFDPEVDGYMAKLLHGNASIEVTASYSTVTPGAVVIFLDIPEPLANHRIRIDVNNGAVWDAVPNTGQSWPIDN